MGKRNPTNGLAKGKTGSEKVASIAVVRSSPATSVANDGMGEKDETKTSLRYD